MQRAVNEIALEIENLRQRHTGGSLPLLVALDGRCASGKSTIAARIAEKTGYTVLHMDDFFLPPAKRTAERLATPGGNVDYERFLQEILEPLWRGEGISYRPYSCHMGRMLDRVTLPLTPVILTEGSYACHPALRDAYRLRIFLTVSPEEQLRRIASRNGNAALAAFQTKWIPLEEAYFSACAVADCCSLRYDTTDFTL